MSDHAGGTSGGDARFPRDAVPFALSPDLVASCVDPGSGRDQLFALAFDSTLDAVPPGDRRGGFCVTVGAVAEAVAALFLVEHGFHLVGEVSGAGSHGADLLVLDPALERLVAVEVKGTMSQRRWPRLRRGVLAQMSAEWLDKSDNPVMSEWDLRSADVFGAAVFVNFGLGAVKVGITATFLRFEPVRDAAELIDLDWLVAGR
jgi:hypothetical protein